MSSLTPRPGILDIAPYKPGESKVEGVSKVIKLSSNEGALGASPRAREAYRAASEFLHRYPDGGATRLRAAIAARHGMTADNIVCGCGSDELIGLLCRAYAGPGDEVLYSAHGFLMYSIYTLSVGATPVKAPEVDLTASVDNLLAAVTEKTRIVFVANPNNPTGTYLSAAEVKRLREGLRDDILLVVDAAYAEYVTRNDYTDGRDLVDAHDNVVMTRTFSKIHGLGGARLGWCYAPDQVVDILNRLRSPFNVTSPALAAGEAAIEDVAFTDLSRQHNDVWLPWMQQKMHDMGLDTTDSVGNFALVKVPDADACDSFLRSRGLIVRRMGGYGLPDWLRITVGLDEENHAVIDALAAFLDERRAR
ncbi:Biosynthetic Aromatic amino acid aminotransferase beta [Caenispirillum salinarum AK4]|uniref:Histidinol-phosphate aminotransferase n=1 Tax=Caenispirillum salinarum AK4 TaxID=1238182 RepID=K9GWN3_9PROT|nr:histidinol-phosphate transaminase [Caenispirillum salinarum]EKV29149.1 Biosynthetic Aromatic amino acid aminotransferase beta [Caenispirillum salinarum AK4]